MSKKYLQFDYTEMSNGEVGSLGILTYCGTKATKEGLKEFVREYLQKPTADIFLSNITFLTKSEYEKLTGQLQDK